MKMWSKTTLAALFIIARNGSGVQAKKRVRTHEAKSTKTPSATTEPKSTKSPTSKAGKTVCLEYGVLNEVVAAGSSDPIGALGPNGPGACFPPPQPGTSPLPSAVCCADLTACAGGSSDACDDYTACLQDPANGPVLVGNWWLQRDVSFGEVFFEEGAVCGQITSTDEDSRTRLELWDDTFHGMDLSLFKKFSAGYDFRSTSGGSGGYLNLYLRVDGSSTAYYDCRLDFLIPNVEGTGTLVVTPETIGSSNPRTTGTNPGDDNGCPSPNGQISIQDYLAANPDAVMGVGSGGELYAFVLNTGSTGQDNSGQEVCWSDVSIQYYDESGAIQVESFEFTTI
eukprot:CAMPEP_0201697318 /NCGR_PEP_ID=MMETSP0578-20130828/10683_1 /ASSEMBLY_ACC=CAM_ASM_000663 /TAXON_ID=267565 /ORGANISM="Skeletonema grethea, Strain CCMP 1804" /LENGTH=338 /DNA_ID=CAMNT_0048183463 /DNA_START=76 /DNA_END=1092 /DNA_ORIENTATION=+